MTAVLPGRVSEDLVDGLPPLVALQLGRAEALALADLLAERDRREAERDAGGQYWRGWCDGFTAAEAEMAAAWCQVAAWVRRTASEPAYAELQRRRSS